VNSAVGIVIFGDIVTSRHAAPRASRWLRALTVDLDNSYAKTRLARFAFTQGDELQGLLRPAADPFVAILRASLQTDPLPMRWAVAAGQVDPGPGPATQRTGAAFLAARDALSDAKAQRLGLVVRTGDTETDTLLADVAPAFKTMLDDLTARQREIARLMLVDGLRRSDVADRLGIARPTVSVSAERARVREIAGLGHALVTLLHAGIRS
jgi:hypothetical protein